MKAVKDVLKVIGNTPMVELNNITKKSKTKVFTKLEYLNPSGSLKDRIALKMIEEAENSGLLGSGYTIVESSTGNTGIALSFVGILKGYKVAIYETTPGKMGKERRIIMRNYGAEVHTITPDDMEHLEKSVAGAEVELPGRQICLDLERKNSKVWWARQFSNPDNVRAHNDTGMEMLDQLNGEIDVFVASVGTGGTLMGIAETLKMHDPSIRVVGVQPAASAIKMTPGVPYPKSEIKGGIISDMLDRPNLIDDVVEITDEEAVKMTRRLWREEGLYSGVSSGANVLAALREAKKLKECRVATVLPDSGDRYMTDIHYIT
jgi:cysteine synthase A